MPSATATRPSAWARLDEVGGDRRVLRVVLDALDERAVDLDHVDREAAQLLERREAGAEVVDRDAHAERVQLLELGAGPVAGGALDDDRGLGDLEAEAARRQPGRRRARCARASLTPPVESCLPERLTQVTKSSGSEPVAPPAAPSARRPRAARTRRAATIRPVASATGMNWSGTTMPARRRVPAHERLDARRSRRLPRSISGW